MDFLGTDGYIAKKLLKFDTYFVCGFDLCPLLEAILYNLQSFGGTYFSII